MANGSDAQPTLHADKSTKTTIELCNDFKLGRTQNKNAYPDQDITYIHGKPFVFWEEEDVETIIIKEDLPFGIIVKFSYGWSELEEI